MAMITSVEGSRVANIKRRPAKTKTPPMAVNLGACLRFYAPDRKTHDDAMRKAQNANQRGLGAVGQGVGAGVKLLKNIKVSDCVESLAKDERGGDSATAKDGCRGQ